MSAKIVNLSRARKSRARDDKRQQADANAARFGRTRAEREATALEATKAARHLDQHKREDEEK